jgi:hypothetical protein
LRAVRWRQHTSVKSWPTAKFVLLFGCWSLARRRQPLKTT